MLRQQQYMKKLKKEKMSDDKKTLDQIKELEKIEF